MRIIREAWLLLAVGCSSSTDVAGELEIRTSQTTYAIGAPIETRIVNHTRQVIHVAHCNHRISLLLERRTAGVWASDRQVNGPLCLAIHPMGEVPIGSGAHATEIIDIDEAGEYRLVLYGRRASEDFGSLVSVSRPFTVSLPPD